MKVSHRTMVPLALLALAAGAAGPAPVTAQAPPSWKQGQPAELSASPLAPIAQPPAPTPPERIPVDKIKLPPGFRAELWAAGISNARAMTWGDRGTLFVSSRVAGNVYAVVDRSGRREAAGPSPAPPAAGC